MENRINMFHNDSSVLTKYWAEIWWNPQNKTFQGSGCLQDSSAQREKSPHVPHHLTHLADGLFILLIKESTSLCAVSSSFQNPIQAHYQHSSIHICISGEKQNSKSFQATSALLGSYKNWQLGEMRMSLSSPFKLTQEMTRVAGSNCAATLTTISTEKDHPGNEAQVFHWLPPDHTQK